MAGPQIAPPVSPDGAGRDALASLRARLVAMGGLADLSRPAGSRRAIACAPPAPPAQRAGALGVMRLHGGDNLLTDQDFECAGFGHRSLLASSS